VTGAPAAARRGTGEKSREKPELIADELRSMIVTGKLLDGSSLGRESDLVERFGVSRPSLREALRILEAEGLVKVVRGVRGGVVVRQPDERITARNAALVLQFRNTTIADVHEARSVIEPAAAKMLASARNRRAAAGELRKIIAVERDTVDDPVRYGEASTEFHERLVALAGNQTLGIVAEMLNEIIARAVTAVSQTPSKRNSLPVRQRGIRSQERLIELIAIGASNDAEAHWRAHMDAVGKVMIGHMAKTVVDLLNHY
jgi:GntR family transcriptional regulator, transcriptional repressor for pyruvate dehydrogenase complex